MTDEYELFIPGRPRVKGRPRLTRSGRAYTPATTLKEEARIREAFQDAFPCAVPFDGAVAVSVDYMREGQNITIRRLSDDVPKWRGDTDNLLKLTLDALNGIAYVDDALVVHLQAFKSST